MFWCRQSDSVVRKNVNMLWICMSFLSFPFLFKDEHVIEEQREENDSAESQVNLSFY